MPDSRRERILQALAGRTGGIRAPLPGDFDDRDQWPLVALIDGDDVVQERRYGRTQLVMQVRLEKIDAFEDEDGEPIHDKSVLANRLLVDLIQVMTGADRTLGGLADDLYYTGGSTVYPETGGRLVAAYALFSVVYRIRDGDPFAEP